MDATEVTRPESGFTLVEILVTVVIMTLGFVTLIEGIGVFFHSTTVRRATASLDSDTRNYATTLTDDAYVDCAAAYAAAPAAGTTASVTIDYWDGDATPASFSDRASCLANGEKGAQRLHLTLTDTVTNQTDQLTIVKRKP